MKQKIKQLCKDIEQEENIRILFCVESGSRVWRIDSVNSDYDVRFVFVRPLKEYVQINRHGEVLTRHYNKQLERVSAEGCYVDVCGFDIFKYTKMLSDSNPTSLEWLQSDIIYYGDKPKVFVDFALNNFKPISVYHHYKSMCRQNYLKYLQSNNDVTYKRYLYALRGLVNAKWVVGMKCLPPISFPETLKQIRESELVPTHILDLISDIITFKKQNREKEIVGWIPHIDTYIEGCLKDDSDAPTDKVHALYTELNNELRNQVIR